MKIYAVTKWTFGVYSNEFVEHMVHLTEEAAIERAKQLAQEAGLPYYAEHEDMPEVEDHYTTRTFEVSE